MSIITAYTLTEAREMLSLFKAAYKELVTGQAKAYRVGTREYTALDIDDLRRQIEYFANIVEALSGNVRTKRVARVVPRDL